MFAAGFQKPAFGSGQFNFRQIEFQFRYVARLEAFFGNNQQLTIEFKQFCRKLVALACKKRVKDKHADFILQQPGSIAPLVLYGFSLMLSCLAPQPQFVVQHKLLTYTDRE